MDSPPPMFLRWRIMLGFFGVVLLVSSLSELSRDISFDWWSFGLAIANLSAAYLGFANRPRGLVKLAVVWSSIDLLVVAWTVLSIFMRHAIDAGSWNFQAIH